MQGSFTVEELDINKNYLVQVEIGNDGLDQAYDYVRNVRELFEQRGFNNCLYTVCRNGVPFVKIIEREIESNADKE